MNQQNMNVLVNVIGAVESGGQVYGRRNYAAYTPPYCNSNIEHTITLGWGQYYGVEAKKLIQMIHDKYPDTFKKLDTAGIAGMLSKDWVSIRWNPSAAQKKVLIALIDSEGGHICQDDLFKELMNKFIADCEKKYTKDIKAIMMYCEIRHLGGSAVNRIFDRLNGNYSLDSIMASLVKDQNDNSNDNQVGDSKFWSRHLKCKQFIEQYAVDESTALKDSGKEVTPMYSRQKVVDLANSWVGKNEADGSYKSIIDIYNTLPVADLPRKTKMLYSWAWCACTWSALAIKLGYTAIMPIEISCYYIIERAKAMGIWVEKDSYVPSPGDAVLYDWDDGSNYANYDNTGGADHIGTVVSVNKASGYFVVVEGNYSNSVKKRTVSINGRYIRGFICPKYDDNTVSTPASTPATTAKKSVDTVAHEVIAGDWGNGDARFNALKKAGYDADAVQKRVSEILNGSAAKPTTTEQPQVQPVAKKVVSTCYAQKLDKSLAWAYKTTTALYIRNDAGTNKKALAVIPKGTECRCYGYYTPYNGVKWLYIQVTVDGVQYTGFSSSGYLKKA